jgi:hypothetical protein
MTALLIHICAACGGTSQPSEAEPDGWRRYGADLFCSHCLVLRRTGMAGSIEMMDREFVERVRMTRAPEREKPVPMTICAGCAEAFPAGSGSEFCPGCTAKRANPRHFSPAELEAAGLDPKVVLGEWVQPNRAS